MRMHPFTAVRLASAGLLTLATFAATPSRADYPAPQIGTISPADVERVKREAELMPPLTGEWENNEARERDAALIAERAEAAEARGAFDDNDTVHYGRGITLVVHVFINHTGGTWDTNEMNNAGAKADNAKTYYVNNAWWAADMRFDPNGAYIYYGVTVPYNIPYDGLNESIMEDALARIGFGDGDFDGWRIDDATHYLQSWGGGWDNVIMCFEPDVGGRAWASYGHGKCELYTDSAWNVFAHEWGHLFGACDEYAEGGSCNGGINCGACQSWYLNETVNNSNCELGACGGTVDCLMKYNSTNNLCGRTPRHWAWMDDDFDGLGNTVRRPVGAGPTYANIWELYHNGWFVWNDVYHAEVVSQRTANWAVIGLRSPPTADYDLQVYTDNTHNVYLAGSAFGTGAVDFVVADYHHNTIGNEHIQAIRYSGSADNYNMTWESGGEVLYPDGISRAQGWGWYNTAVAYDVPLFAGETITFNVTPTSGLDLGMALYRSNGATFFGSRAGGAVLYADSFGAWSQESFTYSVPADDVYGLIVWSNNSLDGSFNIQIGPGQLAMAEEVTYWNNANPSLWNYSRTAGPYWAYVGTLPLNGTDATLKLYDDANFIYPLETSANYGVNSQEFVAVDYNHVGSSTDYLRVLRGGGTGEYYTQWEQDADILYGAEYPPYWNWYQLGKMWDVSMNAGQTYFFRQYSDGALDGGMYLFDSSNGDYYKRRADWTSGSDVQPPGVAGEWFWYTPGVSDWFGLAATGNNLTQGNYSMWFGPFLWPSDEVPVARSEPVVWAQAPLAGSNYWQVAATRAEDGATSSMWMYNEPTFSGAGFKAFDSGAGVRFVVADYNHIGGGAPYYTLTQRSSTFGTSTHSWEGGFETLTFNPTGTVASGLPWEATNVAKIYDTFINGAVASGQNCMIEVVDDTGTMDLGIAIFNSAGTAYYAGSGSAYKYADANGLGGAERITFNVTAADWYGLVIFNKNANAGTYSIYMRDPTLVGVDEAAKPLVFDLRSASANPFFSATNLSFSLERNGQTDLVIYDVRGRQVKTLVHGEMPAGAHSIAWDGADLAGNAVAPGVYIARLTSSGSERRIKLMKAAD